MPDANDDRSVAASVAGVEGVLNVVSLYRESGLQTFHTDGAQPDHWPTYLSMRTSATLSVDWSQMH